MTLEWSRLQLDGNGTMKEVGAFEARNRLGQLFDLVEAGEDVAITRRGKPIARMVPSGAASGRERARQAAARIRAMRKDTTLGGLAFSDLIGEGRL